MLRRSALVAGLLGCMIASAATAPGCGPRSSETGEDDNLLATEVFDFTMEHLRADELRWRMKGIRIDVLTTDETRVVDPRVTIYQEGIPATVITGDHGTVDRDTNNLVITGAVRAVSRDGVLYTEKLLWDDLGGKLIAPGDAEIHRGRSVIRGTRMDGRPDLKRVHMDEVRFHVRPDDETVDAHVDELDTE